MLFSFLFARYFIWDGSHFVFFQQWWNSFLDWALPVGTGSQIINGTFDLNGQNRGLMHQLKVRTTHYKIAPFECTTEEVSFEYFIHRLKVRTILHFYTIDWEWATAEAISKGAYVWCSESCSVSYHSDSLSHKKVLTVSKVWIISGTRPASMISCKRKKTINLMIHSLIFQDPRCRPAVEVNGPLC